MFSSAEINKDCFTLLQPVGKKNPIIRPGVITFCHLDEDLRKGYYVYRPLTGAYHNALFVTIHGISRNAYEHVFSFIHYAERYGITIVAPLFSRALFPSYQKMGQTETEQRADRYFRTIINQAGTLAATGTDKIYLFGYSGGAQFAHRYMMAYPERVASIALGAAGWYTFPDPNCAYILLDFRNELSR